MDDHIQLSELCVRESSVERTRNHLAFSKRDCFKDDKIGLNEKHHIGVLFFPVFLAVIIFPRTDVLNLVFIICSK